MTPIQISFALALVLTAAAFGASAAGRGLSAAGAKRATSPAASAAMRPCELVTVDPPMSLALGKSRVLRLPFPAVRLIVGGQGRTMLAGPAPPAPPAAASAPAAAVPMPGGRDGVAETDITLLSPTELFLLGRRTGSMNVVVQGADGRCVVKDIVVTVDPGSLQAKVAELMPQETGVRVRAAENSLVLTGTVTDAARLDDVLTLARSYAEAARVINLLRVTAPQQVMLEVKIAEVSKTLLDRLGLDFARAFTTADGTSKLISGIIGGAAGLFSQSRGDPAGAGPLSATRIGIDAKNRDGIIRVLAEPTIMAISGQSASFLSGGKIFIPVAQDRASGVASITLEEKEFGVGLRFTPTVLDGRVNLKIVSEVSELSQTGTPFTTVAGATSVLPSMATRKVDTTVQLGDGQSFAVAGLIRHNMTESLDKFPGLGEAPVLGALFRSTEFQNDQTELMFVVTPHLVQPVSGRVPLPTDNHVVPTRAEVLLQGKGEGAPRQAAPAVVTPAKP